MSARTAAIELLPRPRERRVPATGAVDAVQEAELSLTRDELDPLWSEESLERLAHAYWLHLGRASRGLLRVVYGEGSRSVVLASRLPLLRFRAPEYRMGADRAAVVWRVDRGLLVAADGRGRGWLRIGVERLAPGDEAPTGRIRVAVEVRNFYPWLRGRGRFARVGAWIYSQTQLRIHRRITIGFLRSLASLDLPPRRAVDR